MGKNKLYNIKFPNKLAVATQYVKSRFNLKKGFYTYKDYLSMKKVSDIGSKIP